MTTATVASRRAISAPLVALATLTVAGFVLRVVGMDQSLYNDEYLTHAIVTENGLPGVIREVYETSVTPPLHYVIAWLAVQLPGDTTVLVRLPSLLFGVANIPLVFLLGRRVAGDRVGILAATLMTLSPFAIYYSDEARTYQFMVFLVGLSTLALLRATDGSGRRWWIIYAVSSCAVLYAHYTAVFVLAAQAGWAIWARRDRLRELLLAQAAIAVGFLPWVPGYLKQRENPGVDLFNAFATNSLRDVFELPLRTLIGHTFVGLEVVPGKAGLVALLAVVVLAVAAAASIPRALRRLVPALRSEPGLMLILALATPVGLLLYDLVGPPLYGARNLSASQPALIVLIAFVLSKLAGAAPIRVAAPALACLLAALIWIAADSVGADTRRPPYREAAHYLDEVADGSPVIEVGLVLGPDKRIGRSPLSLYFDRKHPVYPADRSGGAWRRWRAGGEVYMVSPEQRAVLRATGLDRAPADLLARRARLGGPDGRAIVRGSKTLPGFEPVTVRRYQGAVHGRLERGGGEETISWSLGRHVRVWPGVAVGSGERLAKPGAPFVAGGWALDANRPRPVDWVLAFAGRRLVGVSPTGVKRPDIAAAHGPGSMLSGFTFWPVAPHSGGPIRLFGVVGDRASELPIREGGLKAGG
jgi:hypothetical protein